MGSRCVTWFCGGGLALFIAFAPFFLSALAPGAFLLLFITVNFEHFAEEVGMLVALFLSGVNPHRPGLGHRPSWRMRRTLVACITAWFTDSIGA